MSPRRTGTSSPSHFQNGGEGTVGAVLGGEDADGFSELEAVGFGEGFDEVGVFRVLNGASGIDDAPAGLEAGKGVGEDLRLDRSEVIDVGGLQAPADIDAAADHAGVRAGDVEQDGVEGFVETFGGGLAPIVDGNFIGLDVEAGEVFLKTGEAFFVGVGAGEACAATECGGDEEGLAAGGGAGIEDFLAGLWVEQFYGMSSSWILDVELALGEELGGELAGEEEITGRVVGGSPGISSGDAVGLY